jgi:hypothetical protein
MNILGGSSIEMAVKTCAGFGNSATFGPPSNKILALARPKEGETFGDWPC